MKFKNHIAFVAAMTIVSVGIASAAPVTILSDSFSRSPAGTPVGTIPSRDTSPAAQATAGSSWVSSWGANNNAAGGVVTQTYTSYLEPSGNDFKVDGSNGISGNYLNNGAATLPLKYNQSTTTTLEPIGLTGFAWTQINHNFNADTNVQSNPKLRVTFDLYRSAGGNMSWFFGQSDATGVNNGVAGSPATIGANDVGLYWRGGTTNTYGLRDNGSVPAAVPGITNYDTIAYATGTNFASSIPAQIRIDITGTDFDAGQTSLIELWVNGVVQDLNGSAAGAAYTFTWDAGGAAYMGFGSNNTSVEGTLANPVYRANGIDNLLIAAVPEPTTLGLLVGVGLIAARRRRA
jgi:PEP-CTERM motif